MHKSISQLRTRYAETDQMKVVYYGTYPQYFEVARVEALRELGMTYRQMEEDGIMLPVFKLDVQYHKPALYDDLLSIHTYIREMPTSRITFHHEIYNEKAELLTTGSVQLVFVNRENMRPVRCPKDLKEKLSPFFEKAEKGQGKL